MLNNNIKYILFFCSGVIAGCGASFYACKQHFKKKYEEDLKMLDDYQGQIDRYTRIDHDYDEAENEINPNEADSQPGGRMTPEERKAIKEKLDRNYRHTTNYAAMYKKDEPTEESSDDVRHEEEMQDFDAFENCRNCFRCELGAHNGGLGVAFCADKREEFDYSATKTDCVAWLSRREMTDNPEEEQMFNDYQKKKGRRPRIISSEKYSSLPGNIEQAVMYYYTNDDTLADENEEVIDDPETFVGDCLTKYGFADNDETIIFVMNYNLATCYEIQKVEAAWGDSH